LFIVSEAKHSILYTER